jgi:hypothetical protein
MIDTRTVFGKKLISGLIGFLALQRKDGRVHAPSRHRQGPAAPGKAACSKIGAQAMLTLRTLAALLRRPAYHPCEKPLLSAVPRSLGNQGEPLSLGATTAFYNGLDEIAFGKGLFKNGDRCAQSRLASIEIVAC